MRDFDPTSRATVTAITFAAIMGLVFLFTATAGTTQPAPPDEKQCPYPEQPPVNPPVASRTWNYAGGSCNHAAIIEVLNWQGRPKTADYWRRNYWGKADVYDLAKIAKALNVDYAIAERGDAQFMQWASDTGRGAAIHWHRGVPRGKGHAVTFCGYFNGNALLIDNNSPRKYIRVPKQQFIREWRSYGGYAMTTVYDRPQPKPWS